MLGFEAIDAMSQAAEANPDAHFIFIDAALDSDVASSVGYRDSEGCYLVGALAALDCEVEDLIERHSHAIVIGRVREIRLGSNDAALLYWRGDYERLGWMAEEATTALGLRSA